MSKSPFCLFVKKCLELKNLIIDIAKEVRKHLTPGFEEKIYKRAMYLELVEADIPVEVEVPLHVMYKGHVLGDYRADMVVDNRVIVELKAVSALSVMHEIQLVNYLTATGIEDGILINFGGEKIEYKTKTRLYKKSIN